MSRTNPESGADEDDVRSAAVAAADEIWSAHAPALRSAALKLGFPRQHVDAAVREIFAAYFANPPQVADLRTYLLRAVCNAARHRSRNFESGV